MESKLNFSLIYGEFYCKIKTVWVNSITNNMENYKK